MTDLTFLWFLPGECNDAPSEDGDLQPLLLPRSAHIYRPLFRQNDIGNGRSVRCARQGRTGNIRAIGGLRCVLVFFLRDRCRLRPVFRRQAVAGCENIEPADYKQDSKKRFFHISNFFKLHWIRLPLSSLRCRPLPWQYFQYLQSAHSPVRIHSRWRILAKRFSQTSTKSSV